MSLLWAPGACRRRQTATVSGGQQTATVSVVTCSGVSGCCPRQAGADNAAHACNRASVEEAPGERGGMRAERGTWLCPR
eukprot:352385-Chlamydomonas_euryale.AAC.4